MFFITDEQLDSLGNAYRQMVDKEEIRVEETPFYTFVELNLESVASSRRKCVVLCH